MAKLAHALFGASGSYKWINCGAALCFEKGRPDKQTDAAINGTMMHAVGECCLLNRIAPMVDGVEGGGDAEFYVGSYPLATPEDGKAGPKFHEELVDAVNAYVNRVWESYTGSKKNLIFVEQRVNYSNFIGIPNSFGTADAIVLVWDKKAKEFVLEIHDFKGGIGFNVDAENNPQLMLYALGALRRLLKSYDIKRCRLFIHQGRITEVASEWDITVEDLLKFAAYAASRAALARDLLQIPVKELKPAHFNPSEKACRWCKGRDECKAHAKYMSNIARGNFPDLSGKEPVLTKDDLAVFARHLSEMERFCEDIKNTIREKLMSDAQAVPGYKLVAGRAARRVWSNEKRAGKILARAGIEAKEVLPTPADVEKQLKKAKRPEVWERLQKLVEQGETLPVFVDRRDARPEWSVAKKSDFEIES